MSVLEILVLFLMFRNLFFMLPSSSLWTLQHGILLLDLSWLLSSSSAQHKLCLPHPFLLPQTIFRFHFSVGEEGPMHCLSSLGGSEVWTTDSMYCVGRCSKEERFKRKVQTTKPYGEWGRKRCLKKEEALHLKEPDITSQALITKGFSRQSGFMDSGEFQR